MYVALPLQQRVIQGGPRIFGGNKQLEHNEQRQ